MPEQTPVPFGGLLGRGRCEGTPQATGPPVEFLRSPFKRFLHNIQKRDPKEVREVESLQILMRWCKLHVYEYTKLYDINYI